MSKRNNVTTHQQNYETHRMGCTLDAQTHLLINTIATFRGVSTSQIVAESVWHLLDLLPNKEKESILGINRAKFGRINRPFAKFQGENGAGQGGGAENDGLAERTYLVNHMASRFTNAVDIVVDNLA